MGCLDYCPISVYFVVVINLLFFRYLTEFYGLMQARKAGVSFVAYLLLSLALPVTTALYRVIIIRSHLGRRGQTTMSLPTSDKRNFISISAVGEFVKTLASNVQALKVGREIQFDAVLKALLDGYGLSEIRQEVVSQLERHIITQVIIATQGNKAEAARLLRIDYKTLYRKIHKYVAEPVE